jgi:RNA polymerase-binding transcription factor
MNVNAYQRTLLDLRSRLAARVNRDVARGQGQNLDGPGDSGDAAGVDASESVDFSEAELESVTLEQVNAALRRIEDGTFGRCLADGGPIENARLDAVPWAVYCIKHQTLMEAASQPKPTL